MSVDPVLSTRWTDFEEKAAQRRYWTSTARFNVVPAGRRSGKTEIFKRKLVRAAIKGTKYRNPSFFAGGPTLAQARRIYWEDLKLLTPNWLIRSVRESELCIKLWSGSSIWVLGMDKPERIEGTPWDGGGLDEFANMRASAFASNVRPALSDRSGWCDMIGVPEGRNHYYDRYIYARDSGDPEWAAHHWISADVLPPSEIEAARRDLDEQTYLQEYEASFLYFKGRIYYAFTVETHCHRFSYDPDKPILLGFDFNVDPGVCVIAQVQAMPTGVEGLAVIGEVYIPTNSTTPAVCRKIIQDWSKHKGYVICYGDATGGARGSAKTQGSDWDIIKAELRPQFQENLVFNVPDANPPERARINAMNTLILPGNGTIRLMVDPVNAPHVVRDLEGVQALEGGSGEIDKRKDRALTHISDALGYIVCKEYPIHDNQITSHQQRAA